MKKLSEEITQKDLEIVFDECVIVTFVEDLWDYDYEPIEGYLVGDWDY